MRPTSTSPRRAHPVVRPSAPERNRPDLEWFAGVVQISRRPHSLTVGDNSGDHRSGAGPNTEKPKAARRSPWRGTSTIVGRRDMLTALVSRPSPRAACGRP
jgi:hypothetical protein